MKERIFQVWKRHASYGQFELSSNHRTFEGACGAIPRGVDSFTINSPGAVKTVVTGDFVYAIREASLED